MIGVSLAIIIQGWNEIGNFNTVVDINQDKGRLEFFK